MRHSVKQEGPYQVISILRAPPGRHDTRIGHEILMPDEQHKYPMQRNQSPNVGDFRISRISTITAINEIISEPDPQKTAQPPLILRRFPERGISL